MLVRLCSVLLLLILLIAGCTRSEEKQAEVSGKVTYKGQPLPGGRITFFGANNRIGVGTISPQGEYTLKSPLGKVQIGVDNTMLKRDLEWEKNKQKAGRMKLKRPQDLPGGQEQPQTESAGASPGKGSVTGTYVKIPARYIDPSTSGLTHTVESGSQSRDIELSDDSAPKPGS